VSQSAAPDHHLKGVLLVGAASVLWSLGGLIVRSLDTADPWTTIFWRSVFATAALFLSLVVRDGWGDFRVFRDMGLPVLLIGVCFTAACRLRHRARLRLSRPDAGDHEFGAADRSGAPDASCWANGSRRWATSPLPA
jgi:hypothetical protein